jgi:hypothetical protein
MKKYFCVGNRKCFGILLILILLFFLSIKSFGQSTLPQEINKIFFEASKFNQPIWLELPIESSKIQFQNISQNPDIYESGIPSVRIEIGKGLEDYDKYLLSFLVNNNFATIETKIQTIHNNYGNNSKAYNFLFYADNFKKNIIFSNEKDMYGNIQQKPYIKVAHRQVISIDYKNQYEDAPMGMKRTFYSIIYTYKLINDFSGFQNIATLFKGKGKIFLDPDDGNWKMEGPFENLGIALSDNNSSEYLNTIHNSYKPFIFITTVPSVVNNSQNEVHEKAASSSLNNPTGNIPTKIPVTTSTPVSSSYIGRFNNDYSKGEYESLYQYWENWPANSKPVFWNNIMLKSNVIYLEGANFGASTKYENKDLIVKQGDALTLLLKIGGIAFHQKGSRGTPIAKYTLAIQIEDYTGKEYFSEMQNGQYGEGNNTLSIIIPADKLLSIPPSLEMALNFSIKDTNDNLRVLQGFALFTIIR